MWKTTKRSKLFSGFLEISQADVIGMIKNRIYYSFWVCFWCVREKGGTSDVYSSGAGRKGKKGLISNTHFWLSWLAMEKYGFDKDTLFYYILITLVDSCPLMSCCQCLIRWLFSSLYLVFFSSLCFFFLYITKFIIFFTYFIPINILSG
jgi:hypothetical protein